MDENKNEEQISEDDALNPEESEEAGTNKSESESTDAETVESEEGDEGSGAGGEIDFETELDKERKRLGGKIDKERQKRIDAEKQKGIGRKEIEKIVDERVSQTEKRLMRNRAEFEAEKLAGSSAEKDLILFHYDNSIVLTGNIEEDIEKSYALANRKKFQGQISELKKTVQSKKNIQAGGSGAGAPVEIKKQPKYSQEVIEAAQFAGVTPEEFVKKQQESK